MKSPIGYPGGKSRIAQLIVSQFPPDTVRMASPFAGGCHVEILAAGSGLRVDASDLFYPLATFWSELLRAPAELSETVRDYMRTPMNATRFAHLKQLDVSAFSPVEMAAIFYILTKTSYSSLGYSGSFSVQRKDRITETALARLRNFHCPNLSVECRDYQHALYGIAQDTLIYADPPYPLTSRDLYGCRGSMHRGFGHALFSRIIQTKERWIVSYYDTEEIRDLFRGCHMARVAHSYDIRNDIGARKSHELLIMSDYVYKHRQEREPPELQWV